MMRSVQEEAQGRAGRGEDAKLRRQHLGKKRRRDCKDEKQCEMDRLLRFQNEGGSSTSTRQGCGFSFMPFRPFALARLSLAWKGASVESVTPEAVTSADG